VSPRLLATVVAATVALAPIATRANDSVGPLISGESNGAVIHVTSLRERRYLGLVQPKVDASCGAAALATLFRDGYGAPVGEADVYRGMLNVADAARVRRSGFSLFDLKAYATTVGLGAEGFRLTADHLRDLRVPAVVLINVRGYTHFALLRRADARFAYVADPAFGNGTVPLDTFTSQWNGIVLVVLGKGYLPDNVLARTAVPLETRDLLDFAPTAALPGFTATTTFTGTPPTSRL